jgi:hypothetical protein
MSEKAAESLPGMDPLRGGAEIGAGPSTDCSSAMRAIVVSRLIA